MITTHAVCENDHPLSAGESRCAECGGRIKMQWMDLGPEYDLTKWDHYRPLNLPEPRPRPTPMWLYAAGMAVVAGHASAYGPLHAADGISGWFEHFWLGLLIVWPLALAWHFLSEREKRRVARQARATKAW